MADKGEVLLPYTRCIQYMFFDDDVGKVNEWIGLTQTIRSDDMELHLESRTVLDKVAKMGYWVASSISILKHVGV